MRTRRLTLALVLPVFLGGALAGCGDETSSPSDGTDAVGSAPNASSMPTAVPAAPGLVHTAGLVTILAKAGQDPELCLGGVAESLPPQCSGPVISGWDWDSHKGLYDEANAVRWGSFAVTGRFDGTGFEVTGAIPAALYDGPRPEDPDFGPTCPEPEGGWTTINPGKVDQASMEATFAAADQLEDYADSWIDQSHDPAIITVRVTGSVAKAEKVLRATWGGPLCVDQAEHTQDELMRIQEQVNELPGFLSSGSSNGAVEVSVIYDDGSLQAWADQEFGEGLVKIGTALQAMSD